VKLDNERGYNFHCTILATFEVQNL